MENYKLTNIEQNAHFLSGGQFMTTEDLYTTTTDSQGVGRYIENGNGNGFRYVFVGASTLVVGNMIQSPAFDTSLVNAAVPAAVAINTPVLTAITITNGSNTVTASQYAGGSLVVYTAGSANIGEEYTILDNGASTSGQPLVVYLDRPVRTAWSTSTKVTLSMNPYGGSGVVQAPATTLTGVPVGACIFAVTTGQYGFIQSRGVAGVLSDATSIIMGSAVASPSGTAGACTLGTGAIPTVGTAMQAAASGHAIAVSLSLG